MADIEKKSRIFLYIAVFIGNLVAFSAGITVGWSSPVNAKLIDEARIVENPLDVVITSYQETWINSFFILGVLFGPFASGFLCNRLGRKKTILICSGAPLIASYLLLAFGKTIILYYVARFIGGFAFMSMMSTLPHFLNEISKDEIRGTVSTSMNVFLMSGTLYAYVVGSYLSIMWFNISCAIWPAVFLVLFFLSVPESPYYFIALNDPSGAMKPLKTLRSDTESNILKEMETMKYSVEQDEKNIFKSNSSIKAFFITITLLVFQQLSGIIVVLLNAQEIFNTTGSDIPSEISIMIFRAIQLFASFITPLVVDKLSRKLLLVVSAVGMFFSEVPLGLYFYLNDNGNAVSSISWLPLL